MKVKCIQCGIEVDVTFGVSDKGKDTVTIDADGLVAMTRHCQEIQSRGGIKSGHPDEYACNALANSIGPRIP